MGFVYGKKIETYKYDKPTYDSNAEMKSVLEIRAGMVISLENSPKKCPKNRGLVCLGDSCGNC